jgi:hypothetical protein
MFSYASVAEWYKNKNRWSMGNLVLIQLQNPTFKTTFYKAKSG